MGSLCLTPPAAARHTCRRPQSPKRFGGVGKHNFTANAEEIPSFSGTYMYIYIYHIYIYIIYIYHICLKNCQYHI